MELAKPAPEPNAPTARPTSRAKNQKRRYRLKNKTLAPRVLSNKNFGNFGAFSLNQACFWHKQNAQDKSKFDSKQKLTYRSYDLAEIFI